MDKIIKIQDIDNYDDSSPLLGLYKLNKNNFTNEELEKNKNVSLRVYDSGIDLPGILRFNPELSVFQGYTNNFVNTDDGWETFQSFQGLNGKDGDNNISDITVTNLKNTNDTQVYGLFNSVVKTETVTSSDNTIIQTNNLVDNIFSQPVFNYTTFNLTNKNITFKPVNTNTYKLFIRKNEIYPFTPYYNYDTDYTGNIHLNLRTNLNNNKKIEKNNFFGLNLENELFNFYDQRFNYINIHSNGYLTFENGGGDTNLLQNNFNNHFLKYRISFFMGNLENVASNTNILPNRPDIYIGRGNYNELIITINNISARVLTNNNSVTTDNFNNIQIRLWTTKSVSSLEYPNGTIQIIYGKTEFLKPLVGLSDNSVYNELAFTPLNFNNLLDNNGYDQNLGQGIGLGVPKLKAEIIFKIDDPNSSSINLLNSYQTDVNNIDIIRKDSVVSDGITYILCDIPLTKSRTEYSELINNNIYYTKIYNLGNLDINGIILTINSLFDGDNFSDTANSNNSINLLDNDSFTNKNFSSNFNDLVNANNYINVSNSTLNQNNIYENYTSDYKRIYTSSNTDKILDGSNSFIYYIEFKYSRFNVEQTEEKESTDFTKLYKNLNDYTLLLKIVYGLKSDVDNPKTNSFNNTTKVNTDTDGNLIPIDIEDTVNIENLSNSELNYTVPFTYLTGQDDFFKFKLNSLKSLDINLKDATNTNRSLETLKLTLYKENEDLSRQLLTESGTDSDRTVSISNVLNTGSSGIDITYYLVVSGTNKYQKYTLDFVSKNSVNIESKYNLVQFFLIRDRSSEGLDNLNENLNNMSLTDQNNLKTALKSELNGKIINVDEGTEFNKETHIYEITFSSPNSNFLINIYLDKTFIDDGGNIDTFKSNIQNIQFNYNILNLIDLQNVIPLTLSSSNVSFDSLPEKEIVDDDDDDSGGGGGGGSSSHNLNLNTFTGLIHKKTAQNNPDIYRKISYFLTNTYYFHLLVQKVAGTDNNYTVKVRVVSNQNGITYTQDQDISSFTSSNIDKLPYSIHKASGTNLDIIIVYSIEETSQKRIIIEKWRITEPSIGSFTFTKQDLLINSISSSIAINMNNIDGFVNNTGDIEIYSGSSNDIYNFFYLDYNTTNNKISINRIDENNNITVYIPNIIQNNLSNKIEKIKLDISENYINVLYKFTNNSEYNNNIYKKRNPSNNINVNTFLPQVIPGDNSFTFIKNDLTGAITGQIESSNKQTRNTLPDGSNITNIYPNRTLLASRTTFKERFVYLLDTSINNVRAFPENFYNELPTSISSVKINSVHVNDEITLGIENITGKVHAWYTDESSNTSIRSQIPIDSSSLETYLDGNSSVTNIIPGGRGHILVKNNTGPIKFIGHTTPSDPVSDTYIQFNAISSSLDFPNIITPNETNIVYTDEAFAVLLDDGSLINWGSNKYGSLGPDFSDIGSDNIVRLYSNNYSFAAITNTGRVISWGYDIDLSISSSDNQLMSKVYSTSNCFAALRTNGTVIAWGQSTLLVNNGQELKYIIPNTSTEFVYSSDELTNIIDIYSNQYSFLAVKQTSNGFTLLPWGDEYYGGSPYKQISVSNFQNISDDITNIYYKKIVSNNGAYAVLKYDGTIITWGSLSEGGNGPTGDDFVDVYSSSNAFIGVRANGQILIWGDQTILDDGSNVDLQSTYTNPISNMEINQTILDYSYIQDNTYNNEKNLGVVYNGDTVFYIYDDSNTFKVDKKTFDGTSNTYTLFTSTNTINLCEFELKNDKYLKIFYTDNSVNKLSILDVNTNYTPFTIGISFDTCIIVKRSDSKYYLYLGRVEGTTITVENYEILLTGTNINISTIQNSFVENNSNIINSGTILYKNINFIDFVNDQIRFFYTGYFENSSNLNESQNTIFLFRENINDTRSISFNNQENIENTSSNVEINNIKQNDIIEKLDIVELNKNINYFGIEKINYIDYNIEIYNNNNDIFIEIYNNQEFDYFELKNSKFIKFTQIENKFYLFYILNQKLNISKIYYDVNEFKIKKINIINIELKNKIEISNLIKINNKINFVILKNNILKIYELKNEIIEIKYVYNDIINNNICNIINNGHNLIINFNNSNYYYIYEKNINKLNEYYRSEIIVLDKFDNLTNKVLLNENNLYYIAYELSTNNLILKRDNDNIFKILKFENKEDYINKFQIYNFNLHNDKLCLVYSDNVNLKTILIYDLKNNDIEIKSFKFMFFEILNDNILLFDYRNIYKTINVRYLDFKLNEIILNRFTNDFKGDKLIKINKNNNNIHFLLKNEEFSALNILKYIDNSKGKYATIQHNGTYKIIENNNLVNNKKIVDENNNTINLFRSNSNLNNIELRNIIYLDILENNGSDFPMLGIKKDIINYTNNNKFLLGIGNYILKNLSNKPIAIITNNSSFIKYKGLSNNNLDKDNNTYVEKVVESDGKTVTYYYYYGEIEINVLGDFGEVSYKYLNQRVEDSNRLKYTKTIKNTNTQNIIKNENRLFLRNILENDEKFLYYNSNKNSSINIIGRNLGENYGDSLDNGTTFYSYNILNYKNETYLCIGTNSIPNYVPTYGNTEIKGNWKNNTTDDSTDNHYAIGLTNNGYKDKNNKVIGSEIEIPIEPVITTEKNYSLNDNVINEIFWYKGDLYWKTLMEDTNYDTIDNMLTPMGQIGICLNGISIYNFASMTNSLTEVYNSNNVASYSLSVNSSYSITNAYNNEIPDNQSGYVDLNNMYHYHTYPITLEGQITQGTVTNSNKNNLLRESLLFNDSTKILKLYIGHTYYFNQSYVNNKNNLVSFKLDSENYTFNNTLKRNGLAGFGYNCSKFKVPTIEDEIIIHSAENSSINEKSVNIEYKIIRYNISVENGLLKILDTDNRIFNNSLSINDTNSKKLFLEYQVKYELLFTSDFNTDIYDIGFNDPEIIVTKDTDKFTFIMNKLGMFYLLNKNNINDNVFNRRYFNINVYEPESINYYFDVVDNNFKIYESNNFNNLFKFNGSLEYEDAKNYLEIRRQANEHSPILGYAYDGYPIYGPLGYKNDDVNDLTVKYLKSNYTGTLDTNGNPTYDQNGNGDLDICNGIFRRTPEYPNGIYHYVFTIEIDGDVPLTTNDLTSIKYKFRNEDKENVNVIIPKFPFSIGAFRSVPYINNFKFVKDNKSNITQIENKTNFNLNFKSLKSIKNNFLGNELNSVEITEDTNYLSFRNNNLPYVWNFTNEIKDDIFSRDNTRYLNRISDLKTDLNSNILKAYGNVSKFVCKNSISKGTGVRITISGSTNDELCVETYNQIESVNEQKSGAAFLGIALNDTTRTGETVYVCTKGITTIKLGNTVNKINCGSYGVLSFTSENGEIISLGDANIISNNTPVAGYFIENVTTTVERNTPVLFYVQSNFEFN